MLTLQDADNFFSTHLSGESFAGFPEDERLKAIQTAARDIAAAVKMTELPENMPLNLRHAVFEQAVFLLLNPHISNCDSQNVPTLRLAPRAQALLPEFPGICFLRRG